MPFIRIPGYRFGRNLMSNAETRAATAPTNEHTAPMDASMSRFHIVSGIMLGVHDVEP